MRLSHMTWPQVETYFKGSDMVLLSIGSIESHGRHMPLGTDTIIPEHLLEKIEKKSDVLIAPTIPFGACQSLAPFPGTIDIDQEILYQFCRQIFESLYAHGARKFVVLNGHGGNIGIFTRLGLEYEKRGCLVACLNWWLMAWDMNPAWKGGHGGGEETAAILGIDPSLVDRSEIGGDLKLFNLTENLKATASALWSTRACPWTSSAAHPMSPTAAGSGPTTPTPPPRSGAARCSRPRRTTLWTSWRSSRRSSWADTFS